MWWWWAWLLHVAELWPETLLSLSRSLIPNKEESLQFLSDPAHRKHMSAGKAKADGPEVKRGRADLAEVLWQNSNPYKDGRSLGDQWLDAKGKQRVQGPEMRRGRTVWPRCTAGCSHACMLLKPCSHAS